MGIFKSVLASAINFDLQYVNENRHQENFVSALCELVKNNGYRVIYRRPRKEAVLIGYALNLDYLSSISLEVCEKLNYRAIFIGMTKYLSPLEDYSLNKGHRDLIIDKFSVNIDLHYRYWDGEVKVESAFDVLRRIEDLRCKLADKQHQSNEDFAEIENFLIKTGLPNLNKLITTSDPRDI